MRKHIKIMNHIGTDLRIEWPVTIDEQETSLAESEVSVYVSCERFKKRMSVTIEDNTIKFTFFGKDQVVRGEYDLILVLNEDSEGQVVVTEKKAFELYR